MLDTLGPSKRALVERIKEHGPVTVEELASVADLGVTTVRQHLDDLVAGGVVAREARSKGRGRPSYVYRLTEAGHDLYPSGDGTLLQELLRFLLEQGQHDTVAAFFDRFWASRAARVERLVRDAGADDLDLRLQVLETLLREEGFMPEIERREDGTLVVCERHCPYRHAVRETSAPCRLEAEFIAGALRQRVERVAYLPAGHRACTYEIEPTSTSS